MSTPTAPATSESRTRSPLLTVIKNPTFWLALIINIVSTIGRSMVHQPSTLQGRKLGLSATALGFLASAYTVCAMLIRTPYGNLMDRARSPRTVLLGSFLFAAVVYAAFGLTHNAPLYILVRIVYGFTFGITQLAMLLVIGIAVDKRALGSAFGLFLLIPKLFSAYTTKFALDLGRAVGTAPGMFVGAGFMVASGLLCLLIRFDESKRPPVKERQPFNLKTLIYGSAVPFALLTFLISLPSLAATNLLVVYGKDAGLEAQVANYLGVTSLWMGIGGFIFGYFIDKISTSNGRFVITAVAICAAVAAFALGLTTDRTWWLVSAVLGGFGAGGAIIPRAVVVREGPKLVTSLAIATFAVTQDLSSIVSGGVSGIMLDKVGFAATFVTLGILALAAGIIALVFYRQCLRPVQRDRAKEETHVAGEAESALA